MIYAATVDVVRRNYMIINMIKVPNIHTASRADCGPHGRAGSQP